jgi:hypothetical protein
MISQVRYSTAFFVAISTTKSGIREQRILAL